MPALELGEKRNIHYREYRCDISHDDNPLDNPTVLLLHGLGATSESWGLQVPALIDIGFHVIAPDIRGFGNSSYPGGKNSVKDMAADMVELLNIHHLAPSHIVGISMGGTVALQIAIDHPQLVSKLVLVNTFARLRPKQPGLWWYYLKRLLLIHFRDMNSQAELVAGHLFPRQDQEEFRIILINQIRQANPRAYRSAIRSLGRFNVQKRLGEIHLPTLVVSGEKDDSVPLDIQSELAQGIPNARQVIIPNGGHAVIAEQPENFNQILLEFLVDH